MADGQRKHRKNNKPAPAAKGRAPGSDGISGVSKMPGVSREGGSSVARGKSCTYDRSGVCGKNDANSKSGTHGKADAYGRGDTHGKANTYGKPDTRSGMRPTADAISESAARFAREAVPPKPLRDISDLPLPELLLPAGSPLALEAAIEAGADAVYFGARSYSARARAENFDDGAVAEALRLCRTYGVRAYAAVNTRIRDAELADALRLVDLLLTEGADGLIVADLGLCAMIRREFGNTAELHASTQLTPVSSYDTRALAQLGFSRVVAPREITLGELGGLCEKSPVEIEAFIHGAHCVSLSGQCLLSSLIGGRSANRGECAQPCRMQYGCGKQEGALLSLADMCYAPDIPAIISTGVRSLKVEGRQKDASYVYGVGRLYRQLLDERRSASPDEIAALAELFERGFTDGYLRGKFTGMCGVRREDAPRVPAFGGLTRKVALDASLTLRAGQAPTLRLTDGGKLSATVALESVSEPAEGDALTEERAGRQIARLGGTPFELRSFALDTDGTVWLSAAELNELRRRTTDALTAGPQPGASRASSMPLGAGGATQAQKGEDTPTRTLFPRLEAIPAPSRAACSEPRRTASFTCAAQIPPEASDFFDAIYLPYTELTPGARLGGAHLSLPPYMTDGAAELIAPMIRPGDRVLVHSVGQIYFVRELGAIPDASFRLNIWNSECARVVAALCGNAAHSSERCDSTSHGAASLDSALCGSEHCEDGVVTLSPELGAAALRHVSRFADGAAAVVYGKLPVMYTVRCMIRGEACRGGPGGMTGTLRDSAPCRAYLTDRTGARFFVLGTRECANEIYNSVPTWTADRPVEGCREHFVFSDESADAVVQVIEAYKRGAAPQGKVRRVGK